MGSLFAEVFAFVAAAFALGVFVGFLFWRWRRYSMSADEWHSFTADLGQLRQRVTDLASRPAVTPNPPVVPVVPIAALGGEARPVKTGTSVEHELAAERERTAGLVAALEGAEAQVAFLQRRLTELAVADTSSPALARPQQALPPGPVPPANGHA